MTDNFLEHYGVMGMKWGVRKSTSAQNRLIKAAAAKKAKTFSDADLRAKVNRLNMEKQYTTLISKRDEVSQTRMEKAAGYVGGVVQNSAGRAVRRTTKSVTNIVVDSYVTKKSVGRTGKVIKKVIKKVS